MKQVLGLGETLKRLAMMREKQARYRHIVRGRGIPYEVVKRQADIYFLRKYAGWTLQKIADRYGISRNRVRDITLGRAINQKFTICHPKKSCM